MFYTNPFNTFFSFFIYNTTGITRWSLFTSTHNIFYKMFNSASIQQRTLMNWQSLKFTREAWRCKLLVSRHQNTLYRRFLNEEFLV